jgi:antitoxin VapB
MSLNIKDERTHELVRELARRTGTSQTAAVRDAVKRRLAELGNDGTDEAVREKRRRAVERIVAEFQRDMSDADRRRMLSADEWLYDEHGLPQ